MVSCCWERATLKGRLPARNDWSVQVSHRFRHRTGPARLGRFPVTDGRLGRRLTSVSSFRLRRPCLFFCVRAVRASHSYADSLPPAFLHCRHNWLHMPTTWRSVTLRWLCMRQPSSPGCSSAVSSLPFNSLLVNFPELFLPVGTVSQFPTWLLRGNVGAEDLNKQGKAAERQGYYIL